jgi:hypothetical protein
MFPSLKRRRSQQRGFAMVDYLCGTMILMSTIVSVTQLTTMKSRMLRAAKQRQSAIDSVNNKLNQIKFRLAVNPKERARAFKVAQNAASGKWGRFKTVRSGISLKTIGGNAFALIETRPAKNLSAREFIELRVSIEWTWNPDKTTHCRVSTLIPRGAP